MILKSINFNLSTLMKKIEGRTFTKIIKQYRYEKNNKYNSLDRGETIIETREDLEHTAKIRQPITLKLDKSVPAKNNSKPQDSQAAVNLNNLGYLSSKAQTLKLQGENITQKVSLKSSIISNKAA